MIKNMVGLALLVSSMSFASQNAESYKAGTFVEYQTSDGILMKTEILSKSSDAGNSPNGDEETLIVRVTQGDQVELQETTSSELAERRQNELETLTNCVSLGGKQDRVKLPGGRAPMEVKACRLEAAGVAMYFADVPFGLVKIKSDTGGLMLVNYSW